MKAIVTVKFPQNPNHDPRRKKVGRCPVSKLCTDVTGSHHSLIMEGATVEDIEQKARERFGHVTRVEVIEG